MERIAIIDWSGVANRGWHTVKNQKGWAFPTEIEEGRTRIAKLILALKHSVGWDRAYFAMDKRDENRKYFRHYILDEWYQKSVRHAICGEHLWILIDGVWVRPDENGKPIKLTKKLMKELGDLREVEPTEIDEQYRRLVPYYKHSRDSKLWPYETDEVDARKMWGGLADAVAPLVNAKPIRVPGYEADDIAAFFADLATRKSQLVFITADRDWCQLLLRPDTSMFDLHKGVPFEMSQDGIRALTREKIICGDSGDCIPPTLTEDGTRITASKLDTRRPTAETLERNKKLIELRGNPDLRAPITQQAKAELEAKYSWLDLGISDIEREWLEDVAAINTLTTMWSENVFVPVDLGV